MSPPIGSGRAVPALFAAAVLVSSALLFWVELMFAKMVLPVLGGSPTVWTTCLVFFQGTLLAGYAYGHASLRWLPPRRQAVLHLALLFSAALLLPVSLPQGWAPPPVSNPVLPVLLLALVTIGLPLFAVSSTTPIVQKWFSSSRHADAADPYFLFAAGNMGSVGALLLFPLVIEPHLVLPAQSRVWTAGYLAWAGVLMTACAACLWRSAGAGPAPQPDPRRVPGVPIPEDVVGGGEAPSAALRARWLLLSFVPASLLLGVTTHITTDIAPLPLLWVVPLALYLLSFVLVFARRPWPPHRFTAAAFPFLAALLVPAYFFPSFGPPFILPHLLFLFAASLYGHGELARSRPSPDRATGFYLWVAFGGLLGGVFNALIAPAVFVTVAEYPLIMALAFGIPTAREGGSAAIPRSWTFLALPLLPGAVLGVAFVLMDRIQIPWIRHPFLPMGSLILAVFSCLPFRRSAVRFGLAVGAVILVGHLASHRDRHVLLRERNFFGTLAVSVRDGSFHVLTRGMTTHGAQDIRPEYRRTPLTYFTEEGPLGDYLWAFGPALAGKRIAVVGLGAGSLATYGRRGQEITFYEIDPAVERIARDARYFTFLADSEAAIAVVIGDARLKMAAAPDRGYALIVIDAFNSDAIPVHLLTREALAMYQAKLEPGGALLVHFSNRNLNLEPLLGGLALDADSVCLVRRDGGTASGAGTPMKFNSSWAVIVRRPEELGWLPAYPGWRLADTRRTVLWTDAHSSLVGLFPPARVIVRDVLEHLL